MMLFEGVKYFLPSSFSPQRLAELYHVLEANGAVRAQSVTEASHVVTNSHRFEGWQLIQGKESIAVVTEKWVERSLVIGKVQSPSNYSADPSMIFSGVVACAADLQPQDLEVLSAGIPALGGQWRAVLTKDVTHVFTLSTDSDQYAYALAHKAQFDLKIVLPHWFDDVVRLGMGNLDSSPYEWPEPLVLEAPTDAEKGKLDPSRKSRKLDPAKRALFTTSVLGVNAEFPAASKKDIFGERRVLLSVTLELNSRREALEGSIERANGTIVSLNANEEGEVTEEEASRTDECDIFVTKYRSGKAYFKAVKLGKTVGTLAWLFHVFSTGVLSRPLDQLLHYPIPKRPIANFSSHEITITNYTGEAREYLKKLIATMGAVFTPSMSSRNTVLVAAYLEGTKTAKAATWSIPIVSHLWLEDCFVKWQNLTVGLEKYLAFPGGTDFAAYLGDRKVGGDVVDLAEVVRAEQVEEEEEEEQRAATAPLTTQNSARDAREVADLVETGIMAIDEARPLDTDGDAMDIDHEQPGTRKLSPKKTKQVSVSPKKATADDGSDQARAPSVDVGEGLEGDMCDDDEGNEVVGVQKIVESMKARGKRKETFEVKRKGRKGPKVQDGNEDDEDSPKARPKANSGNQRGKAATSPATTDAENEEAWRSTQISSSAAVNKKRNSKNSSNVPVEVDHSSPVQRNSTPKHILSVVMPSLAVGAGSSPTVNAGPSSPPKLELTRTESIRAAASERRREGTQSTVLTPKPRDSSITVARDSSPVTLSLSTKRIAAARASQRLHDEVMPDVLNYQQELRNQKSKKHRSASNDLDHTGTRKRHGLAAQRADHDTDDTARSRKANGIKEAEKKDEGAVERKRRKSATRESSNEEYEIADEDEIPPNQKKRRTVSSKVIKLMTTQVTLSDEVVKVLIELGVKMTIRASECTHLVVPGLVRTEKFLCALAVAPYILSESWANESAAAKRLLPEEQYLLNDKVGEEKYDFSLAEALSRAEQFKGSLLAKKIFYVTSGVSMSRALLKNVVSACGGQVVTQNPSLRVLRANTDRHVISCPEDEAIWQPLAREYPIYNAELLLTGILKQKIEWDNEKFKVPGSY